MFIAVPGSGRCPVFVFMRMFGKRPGRSKSVFQPRLSCCLALLEHGRTDVTFGQGSLQGLCTLLGHSSIPEDDLLEVP